MLNLVRKMNKLALNFENLFKKRKLNCPGLLLKGIGQFFSCYKKI